MEAYFRSDEFAYFFRCLLLNFSNKDIGSLIQTCRTIRDLINNHRFWIMKLQKEYPFVWNYHNKTNLAIKNPKNLYVRQLTWVSKEIAKFAIEEFPTISEHGVIIFVKEFLDVIENREEDFLINFKYKHDLTIKHEVFSYGKKIEDTKKLVENFLGLMARIRNRNLIYGIYPSD